MLLQGKYGGVPLLFRHSFFVILRAFEKHSVWILAVEASYLH